MLYPHRLCCAMVILALPFTSFAMTSLNPSLPPSANFDLSTWSLTLPTPIGGVGNADQIANSVLVSGYTNPPYFFTGSNGSMNFWAPVNGATAANATSPCSELTEEWNGPGSSWPLSRFTTNTLTASMMVSKVPASGLVVIGQIHDNGATDAYGNQVSARPLLKLLYSSNSLDSEGNECKGCIYAEILPAASGGESGQTNHMLVNNLQLNNLFTYSINLQNNGILSVTVNNKSYSYRINTSMNNTIGWGAQQFYFKAGAYLLDHGASSTDGAEVDIYSLNVQHS